MVLTSLQALTSPSSSLASRLSTCKQLLSTYSNTLLTTRRITYSEIQEIKSGAWDYKIDDPEPPPLSTRPTPTPTPSGTPAGTPVPELPPRKLVSHPAPGKRGRETAVDEKPALEAGGDAVKVEEDGEAMNEPGAAEKAGEDAEMSEV